MSLLEINAIAILNRALAAEVGIEVLVESPEPVAGLTLRARQTLYRFRKTNPDYAGIKIFLHKTDPDHRLILVKSDVVPKLPSDPEFGPTPIEVEL